MQTRITELLNIKYPIFQGGMAWVADGDLAGQGIERIFLFGIFSFVYTITLIIKLFI